MKPSVLAVCFFTSPGPIPDNFHTLCRSLAGQSRLSVLTSDLIQDRVIPGVEAAEYVNVSKRRMTRWFSPSLWLQIRRFVRRTPFDLLYLYSEHPLQVPVSMLARARRTLFWCLDPVRHSGGSSLSAAVYAVTKSLLMKRADKIAVACEGMKRLVCENHRVPEQRVVVSFHGVLDNLVFDELQPAARRDIDVLFFGRLYRYKGVDVLLKAVRTLRQRGRGLKVTIVGQGPFVVSPADGVSVIDRYVPDRELAEMVARSRIVAMPYRDATGSQVPQTAFVYGTPVVASRVGCLAEYIEDGVTGLLVPPGDTDALANALDRLLTDGALWETCSRTAKERARRVFDNTPLTARLLAQALA